MTEDELKGFTPTERKILAVLADGERHDRKEFREMLGIPLLLDNRQDDAVISTHICYMRDKLKPIGKYIVSEYYMRRYYYRLVNLVKPLMPIS